MISWGCTIYDHDAHSIDYRCRIEDQARHLRSWEAGNLLKDKNWSIVAVFGTAAHATAN
jgi:galactoside O-acetyltransferase